MRYSQDTLDANNIRYIRYKQDTLDTYKIMQDILDKQ